MILLIIINIVVWGLLHFLISYLCFIIPLHIFLKDLSIFKISRFEKKSQIWQRIFLVKRWKDHILDGSMIVNKSFDKRVLKGKNINVIMHFSAETKRAELTHWLLIPPAFLFFLWNPVWAGWVNVLYAVFANVPFIIVQRYNRGRIERMISRVDV